MLYVVISGTYYKDNVWFSSWNARQKKECVFFYDYDDYVKYIIDSMDYSTLQKLRLNIYKNYQKQIKFTPFGEVDLDGNKFEGYKLQSPIIEINVDDFARLIPSSDLRKKYFVRDNIKEKYFLKSDFINYVQLHVV